MDWSMLGSPHHNDPPHYCQNCTKQDPEILKLSWLGQELVCPPRGGNPLFCGREPWPKSWTLDNPGSMTMGHAQHFKEMLKTIQHSIFIDKSILKSVYLGL